MGPNPEAESLNPRPRTLNFTRQGRGIIINLRGYWLLGVLFGCYVRKEGGKIGARGIIINMRGSTNPVLTLGFLIVQGVRWGLNGSLMGFQWGWVYVLGMRV